MQVLVNFPDTLPIARFNASYLKQALIATLYQVGQLSAYEACLTLGVTRREFEEMLPTFGFSILDDSQASINIELQA